MLSLCRLALISSTLENIDSFQKIVVRVLDVGGQVLGFSGYFLEGNGCINFLVVWFQS